VFAVGGVEGDRGREAAGPLPRHGGELGPAQAAPRGEEGQGLEEVGLAGPVVADEGDEVAPDGEVEIRIGAEVAQDQPGHPRQGAAFGLGHSAVAPRPGRPGPPAARRLTPASA